MIQRTYWGTLWSRIPNTSPFILCTEITSFSHACLDNTSVLVFAFDGLRFMAKLKYRRDSAHQVSHPSVSFIWYRYLRQLWSDTTMKGTHTKYISKNLTVSMMMNYSFSTAAKFVSLEDSFQEKNAMGRSFPAMPYWLNSSNAYIRGICLDHKQPCKVRFL